MNSPESDASPAQVEPTFMDRAHAFHARVRGEVARAVWGLEREVELSIAALLAEGHVLLEGPPGVAKTLFARALATALGLSFSRIQFTPDLMPADVTGTSVFNPAEAAFHFQPGPVFAQLVLCDEINRAPAKTQSALLEAMQEGATTEGGVRRELPRPFVVLATMNPIEQEGTYRLPEAQLDRFLVQLKIGYPKAEVEAKLLLEVHGRSPLAKPADLGVRAVSDAAEIQTLVRGIAGGVRVEPLLADYLVHLLRATRESNALLLGASPRAGLSMLRLAKARAALSGRDFVTPDDIKSAFLPTLEHRVLLEPAEEVEGGEVAVVLNRILETIEVPR
jgi:MoxR-like ATPase